MFLVDKDQVPPQGAKCSVHPDWPAIVVCKKCGDFCCRGCLVEVLPEVYYCPRCEPPALPATRGERFRAHMLDSVIVGVPSIALVFGVVAARRAPQLEVIAIVLGLVLALAVLGTNGYLVYRHGQSIGKRVGQIRIVDLQGNQASFLRIVGLRNAPLFVLVVLAGLVGLSSVVFLVDALVIFGSEERCLHDYIAGTRVVKVPKPRHGE
jgi:uncharacterized RDD family membrane protein YckC